MSPPGTLNETASGVSLADPTPDGALRLAIAAFKASPPTFAVASSKGKFPMAALKKSADGSSFDTVPITHACTAESFEKIKSLVAALSEWEQAAGTSDTSGASDPLREESK